MKWKREGRDFVRWRGVESDLGCRFAFDKGRHEGVSRRRQDVSIQKKRKGGEAVKVQSDESGRACEY